MADPVEERGDIFTMSVIYSNRKLTTFVFINIPGMQG
jgi:hypothetical protein